MTDTTTATKKLSPFNIEAGKRLRRARMNASMSQESLAECVGLTFQQIQKYEKGKNRMSIERVAQFSKILKVPVTYFFKKNPGWISQMPKDQDEAMVLSTYRSMGKHQRNSIMRIMKVIKDPKGGE